MLNIQDNTPILNPQQIAYSRSLFVIERKGVNMEYNYTPVV